MKANYHTHTLYCNHADLTMEEQILIAIDKGLKIIGISEHTPIEKHKGRYRLIDIKDYKKYLKEGTFLKNKYKDKIKVLIGLEVEVQNDYFHKNLIQYTKKLESFDELDFTILGHHSYIKNKHSFIDRVDEDIFNVYLEQLELALKEYKKLIYIAHPDCWVNGHGTWDKIAEKRAKKYIEIAIKYNKALGINSGGIAEGRMYANLNFFKLAAKLGATGILELDAHCKKHWEDKWLNIAKKLAKDSKIQLVEEINV